MAFNNKNIKAVIFDLDGTLIDTEKIYRIVWPKALDDMGYKMEDKHYLQMRSLGRPFAPLKMKEWFGEDFDYDLARKIRSKYFNEYIDKHPIELKKGAIELLSYLRNKNYITAIATATDLKRAGEYLNMVGLIPYIDRVVSAREVKEGKPMPYVYEYAAKSIGLNVDECVAVEDAPNGVLSASRAGLNVIMVPDQSSPDEDIIKHIDLCVDSLDLIMNYL